MKKINKNEPLLVDEESFKIIDLLAKTISTKTGVSYDLLYSEGINKIRNVQKNYVMDVGKSFNTYLKSCMNGYMLNYVRNKSFSIPINRTNIDIYLKYLKYGSIEQTADRLSLPQDRINVAVSSVQNSRNFYQLHGNIRDDAPEEFQVAKWIISRLDDSEKIFIEHKFIENYTNSQMKRAHGKKWKIRLEEIKNKLNKLRKN